MTVSIRTELLNFQRPSEHSIFSPSAADRWINCPFSIGASKDIPDFTSKYAAEGTTAHSVCEALFRQEMFDMPFPNDLSMKMLELEDNGQEMMSSAQIYVDVIKAWLSDYSGKIGKILYYGLERGIPIFPERGCFGTADCLIIGELGCAVIDFKYGKGKAVSGDSIQLRTYAAGVYRFLENVPEDYKFHSVIVQPRIYVSPKEWTYTRDEMKEHLAYIWEAIVKSEQTQLTPCEGNWCYFCPANKTTDPYKKCPAIKQKALVAAQEDFGKFLADMNAPVASLSDENKKRDEALVKIISILPVLQKIASDGMEEFKYRIEQGEAIPNIQLVEEVGRRTWKHNDDKGMEAEIRAKFPDIGDVTKTVTKLKAIGEIEKITGKNSMNDLTVRPISKKLKVVDEESQRILGELAAYAQSLNVSSDDLI